MLYLRNNLIPSLITFSYGQSNQVEDADHMALAKGEEPHYKDIFEGEYPAGVSEAIESVRKAIETQFVFDLGTPRNAADLKKEYQQYKDVDVNSLEQGHAYVTSTDSTDNLFSKPREIIVRPRVTRHGGQTQIFNNPS